MIDSTPTPCLLCGENKGYVHEEISGLQLRRLWEASGHTLSDRALGPIDNEFGIRLFQCASCGFRFYDPALAGTAEFYEELMTNKKYPDNSPEFMFALRHARDHGLKNVLDVGCGEGAFLDLAREQGLGTYGVELNRNAAAVAAGRGHRMASKLMQDITLDEVEGGIDFLTLFQVVEHVSSPVDFLRAATRLVRPGGFIVVGVPNEHRMLGLVHHDPANWPPHHVSRWRPVDLSILASRSGLEFIQHGSDCLTGRGIEWAWTTHNQFAAALGRPPLPGSVFIPRIVSIIYRTLRLRHIPFAGGLSIYAIYRKRQTTFVGSEEPNSHLI
jgi:SAM-dependent methyltransferase